MHTFDTKSKRKFAPITNIIAYGNRLCKTPETVKLVLSFVCNLFFRKTGLRSYDYEHYSRRNMLKTGTKILNERQCKLLIFHGSECNVDVGVRN